MRKRMRIVAVTLGLALLGTVAVAPDAGAQQGGVLNLWVDLGVRLLDISGGDYAEAKYAEDVDLQDGVRLLALGFSGNLSGNQVGVNLYGWGPEADPVSSLSGLIERPGVYRFKFGGFNARYFHTTSSFVEDFELGAPSYAYARRTRNAELVLPLGDLPDLYLRYNTFRRSGNISRVWNIEREKHSAFSPVDETYTSFSVATAIPISIASVELSYTLHSLDNLYGATIADTSLGLDGRPSVLYDYEHLIKDEGSLPVLKASVAAPIGPATVRVGYSSSSGSVDKTLTEIEDGIDYQGSPMSSSTTATGSVDRTFTILDAGVGVPLISGFSADLALRQTDYEVEGLWGPVGTGTIVGTTVSSTRLTGRVIWRPTAGVTLDVGGANVVRNFEETGPGAHEAETTTTDWIGGLTYNRQEWFTLRFSHRIGDIQDPFTRLSPTDRNVTRTSLTVKPLDWLHGFAAYEMGSATRYYSHEESDPQYFFNTRTGDVRSGTFGLTVPAFPFVNGLAGSLAYTRGRLELSVPISATVPPTPNVFNYRDITHGVTGHLSWDIGGGFAAKASGSWFRATGQWPLYRYSRLVGISRSFGAFSVFLDFRQYALNLVADDLDDYEANVITIGIGRGF